MKKKIYNTPTTEFVKLDVDVVMQTTSPEDGGFGDWEDQATQEHQGGSWNDIWGNMQ